MARPQKRVPQIVIHRTVSLPESSILDTLDYDVDHQVLLITFTSRPGHSPRTYRYLDVPENVIMDMIRSPSAGSYFTQHIRGKFATEETTHEKD